MITVKQVTMRYDHTVLDGFSHTFEDNGVYCLQGPSGQGKTTLLRVIAGLTKPQSGTVDIGNTRISLQFQEDRLLPWMDVARNITIVNEAADVAALLEALNLSGQKHKLPAQLSGGMRRRVSLARAIAYGGDALLLDEPFQGLDDQNKSCAIALILRQPGIKIIVSHDAEDAQLLGAQIVMLADKT